MISMDQELISIIVPVYQVEDYLCASLNCVIEQTYSNWELILVDDGSGDGSGQICDAYAERDPRIRVFHQENQGVSAARNHGIKQAKGSYVIFLDSDDLIRPDYLEVLYRDITEQNADIVCCNALEQYGEELRDYHCVRAKRTVTDKQTLFEDAFIRYEQYGYIVWGKLFRMEWVKDHSFLPLRFTEDTLFVMQLFARGPVVYLDDYSGYIYVQRAGSAMKASGAKNAVRRMDSLMTAEFCFQAASDLNENIRKLAAGNYANSIHAAAAATVALGNSFWGEYRKQILEHLQKLKRQKNYLDKKAWLRLWLYEYIPIVYWLFVKMVL